MCSYDSVTPVTMLQGQGHQTWHEQVQLKQGYSHSKFEKPCLNSIWKKANIKVFVRSLIRGLTECGRRDWVEQVETG